MRNIAHTIASATIAVTIVVSPLAAQNICTGPGAAFGVVAYQCGDCTMQQRAGLRPVWQFRAEPLILKTEDGSPLHGGDIVEAVNGRPITTADGAEQFTYPAAGVSEIVVRRDGRHTTVQARAKANCSSSSSVDPAPPAPSTTSGPGAGKPHGRFGFAISCTNCTRIAGAGGAAYWQFSSNPEISDLDADGPAANSGLHVGDVIVEVDGQPVLEEAGSLALGRADQAASLRLTVRRAGGSPLTVTLRPREHQQS